MEINNMPNNKTLIYHNEIVLANCRAKRLPNNWKSNQNKVRIKVRKVDRNSRFKKYNL